jgi:hypothetical protein
MPERGSHPFSGGHTIARKVPTGSENKSSFDFGYTSRKTALCYKPEGRGFESR